jgi:hypothetical protein
LIEPRRRKQARQAARAEGRRKARLALSLANLHVLQAAIHLRGTRYEEPLEELRAGLLRLIEALMEESEDV